LGDALIIPSIFASRIVCCQRQFDISVKSIHKMFKVLHPALYVLTGAENIFHPSSASAVSGISCIRPLAPFFGNDPGVVPKFSYNDGLY